MTDRGDLHVRGNSTPGGISGVYRCLAVSVMVSIAEHSVTEDGEENGEEHNDNYIQQRKGESDRGWEEIDGGSG